MKLVAVWICSQLINRLKMKSRVDRTERKEAERITIVHSQNHLHTIVWIHGLDQAHQLHLNDVLDSLGQFQLQTKMIYPKAPIRHVSMLNKEVPSWFDLKVQRSSENFIVPFDEAFSASQVQDSFHNVLLPILVKESAQVRKKGGKLIVAGFSQGCGMSIHCLYSRPDLVDGAIGIGGYFFPITKYDPTVNKPLYIIHGKNDELRPWDHTKVTYYGKVSKENVTLVEGMEHNVTNNTKVVFASYLKKILEPKAKL